MATPPGAGWATEQEADGWQESFAHQHQTTCDRTTCTGYRPHVGDLVHLCGDSKHPATWYVDEVTRDGMARLMPFKNGVPGWWWRSTHVNVYGCHLTVDKAATQGALF